MSSNNYELIRELGRGSFGITYLALNKKNDKNVAIKTINIDKTLGYGKIDINSVESEVNILKRLSLGECNKHVVCYIDCFEGDLDGNRTIFIVTDYIKGQTLLDFIHQSRDGSIDPKILWPIYSQLLVGLKFIHDRGFAHRDIKPDNILITDDNIVKYVDFGLACFERYKKSTCKNFGGMRLYMPPEIAREILKEISKLGKSQIIDIHPSSSKISGSSPFIDLVNVGQSIHIGPWSEFQSQAQIANELSKEKEFIQSLDEAKLYDIWSLGVTMYQLANGINSFPYEIPPGMLFESPEISSEFPYGKPIPYETPYDPNMIFKNIAKAPTQKSKYSLDDGRTNEFLNKILINDYRKRPTINEAMCLLLDIIFSKI